MKKFFKLSVANIFVATLMLASPAASAFAEDSSPGGASDAQSVDAYAVWLPYDGFKITTEQKCESHRQWLVRNVGWVNAYNSDCHHFWTSTCPSKRYWMVMILDRAGYRSAERSPDTNRNSNIDPADYALSC